MMGKSKDAKQPKAVRHDVAKEKCKIYQRSISSHLRTQSKELVPIPGQFALQPGPTLTTNIKAIMRQQHPESASHLLSQHSSRKNSVYKTKHLHKINSEVNLKSNERSDSVKEIKTNVIAKRETEGRLGQNRNSYLVKSRSQIPKFSQGYRIVKLDNPSSKLKLNITKQSPAVSKWQLPAPEKSEQAQFLPVEYYLIQDQKPANLMSKFKIGSSDYVLGFSRWYDLEGKSCWKKCRVLRYIEESGRWQIEWLHNGKQKEISRINLYFEGENRNLFEMRVATAEKYRKLSEVYLRYNIQIDEMQTETPHLNSKDYQRIVLLIGDKDLQQRSEGLLQQVNRLYIRSNHQAQFNATLPFNKLKREEFEQYLPKYLFQPNQQYKMRYCISKAPEISQPSKSYFQAAGQAFRTKTSFGNVQRLKILEFMQNFEEESKHETLISWKNDKIYGLDQLFRGGEARLVEFSRKVSCAICDIEHHIGNQLDQLYLKKKTNLDQFQTAVKNYGPFLSMIIIRLENTIRKVFTNTVNQFIDGLSLRKPSTECHKMNIQILLLIKDGRLECQPQATQIRAKFHAFIDNLKILLQNMHCPTKSYLNVMRPGSLMRIIYEKIDQNQEKLHELIEQCLKPFETKLDQACEELNDFMNSFTTIAGQILGLTSQIRKQVQRKCTYAEFNELAISTNVLEKNLSDLGRKYSDSDQKHWSVNIFQVRAEDAFGRVKKRLNEGRRQLYKSLLDRILKDNQKIQKMINGLGERLECNPTNILQMLSLQKLVRIQVREEMEKINIKLKEIPSKIQILESIEYLDYRDYEACNKIFVFPLKIKEKLSVVKRELESTYRKRFGQQLNRDAGRVLQTTRECGEELIECLKMDSLTQMCDKFMQFSNLHDKIERGLKEAELLNDRETAMNWSKTEFLKLKIMSSDFSPYYSLITLAKNYQLHLQLLAAGPFREIEHQKLHDELQEAKNEILKIKEQFSKNPKMLRVVNEVNLHYSDFSDHLPLIKVLRNPDLRQRHWSTIRQIILINPLQESVSLQNLLKLEVKAHIDQLEQISTIASRQLVYERRLIKLKREWKEIRLLFEAEGEGLKRVTNLKELRQRVEADIFQIQDMLSANFIKFLESEILCWRNQILYRTYELLERWEKVQTDVLLVAAIFTKQKAKEELSGEYIRFQILEKAWRVLCNQIESQPWLADTLQGRAFDSLGALSSSTERMKKHLYDFFEDKKKQYARLACLSDDQFVNLLSCDETDTSQNAVFQQTVRKCFQNIRTLVRNERQQIVKITTRAYEEIPFQDMEMGCMEKIVESALPNEIIMDLEKKIQKELKSSLERIINNPHNHTAQILLLYQRLNFTLRVEDQIIKNHCITAAFLHEIEQYRDQLADSILESPLALKNQCQLLQTLYHLQITSTLYSLPSLTIDSFHWLSQPRTYLRENQYAVEVGLLTDEYGFQIVDLDNLITEEWSARAFCSYAGAIRERGFCIARGGCTAGKTASIQKLAALFGHKQYILDSSPLVSARNLLQYLRMAASGIWVILRNLQRLNRPQLSLMARNLQVFWINHITRPKEGFMIEGSGIMLKTSYLKAFSTIDSNLDKLGYDGLPEINYLKHYFRVIYLPKIDIQFIVNAKLLVIGLEGIDAPRICSIIDYLREVLSLHSHYFKSYSFIYLIIKLFEKVTILKKEDDKKWGEQIVDISIVNMINDIVKEENLKDKILRYMSDNFRLNVERVDVKDSNETKADFSKLQYHYNNHLLQTYIKLIESIQTHFMVILVAPHDTGKSALINMLTRNNYIQLKFICPNAYQTHELYGNDLLNGVIACLIEEVLAQLKADNRKKRGLAFDGELGLWVQPLTTVMSSGHIIQPNGNTLLIQQEIKFIFECRTVSKAAPNLLLNSAILIIQDPLKWQNIFTWYIKTQFQSKYQQPTFIKFVQLFIPFIVDPLIQFYESTLVQLKVNRTHCYISPSSLILSLLRLYESLLDYYFLDKSIQSLNEKDGSDSFNIFVMALIWTIGAIFPQESHKSFSRHFKYLIIRALQANIQGVSNQSLPAQDQDLYKIYYNKGHWQEWNDTLLHPVSLISQNQNLLVRKTQDMGLAFILERYLQKNHSVFLIGQPATQKSTFFDGILQGLSSEVYNLRRVIFGPNSQVNQLKKQIMQEMVKEKYSYGFKGFVHGKKTLISIWDVNLPMVKHEFNAPVSAHEFIRHYFITGGWYLRDSSQHFTFQNIIFCGTLNIRHSLPICLLKYINIVFRPSQKQDLSIVISRIFVKSPLNEITSNLVSLITNLHSVITRQLTGNAFINFQSSDALNIGYSLIKMGAADKIEVLRRWIFLSEKIYQQKLESDQSQRLFYLINNVLMQQQKIRYKSIKPNPSIYHTYFPNPEFNYHNFVSLKAKIESACKQAMESEYVENHPDKAYQIESKMDEFVSSSLHLNLEQYNQHISSKNHMEIDLKPNHVKLIAHLINTFQIQTSFIISLSVEEETGKSSSLDLQECLEIAAVTRKAKLVDIKLGQECWKSSDRGSWRGIILGVIQQILNSIERDQTLNEVIIFLDDFKSENDYILDDFIAMKRLNILPFSIDAQKMMEYFLQNSGKSRLQQRKVGHAQDGGDNDYYDMEGKAKGREKRYQLQRKEKQRTLKSLHSMILSKIKGVINIREHGLAEAKINPIYKCYSDSLREFSMLNMLYFAQSNTDVSKQWSADMQPSCVSIKSNMIITEVVNKQQQLKDNVQNEKEVSGVQINLKEDQNDILQSVSVKMVSRYHLEQEQKWLRGKNNDLKLLYFSIRERISRMCKEKLQITSQRLMKIKLIEQFRQVLIQKQKGQQQKEQQMYQEYKQMRKQKLQREMQYETCMINNQSIQTHLIQLKRQKQVLDLEYQNSIGKVKNQFSIEKQALLECLKIGRDKKIVAINNQVKIYLQALGVVINKKIKKDEEMYKEIIKDINTSSGNAKILKKISNILSESYFNVSEKIMLKVRELVKSQEEKEKRSRPLDKEKEESFLDRFIKTLKHYFGKLLQFYNKTQQKEIKQCLQKLSQNQKTQIKVRQSEIQSLQNSEYKSITEKYQYAKQNLILLQKQMSQRKHKKIIREYILGKLQTLFGLKHPLNTTCEVHQFSCSLFCWIKIHLKQQQKSVNSIYATLQSYAFTVAMNFYYNLKDKSKQFEQIMQEIKNDKLVNDTSKMKFIDQDLKNLIIINKLAKIGSPDQIDSDYIEEHIDLISARHLKLQKEIQEQSILSLIQFVPGTIVLGLERGSLGMKTKKSKEHEQIGLIIDRIRALYGQFVISITDLLGWIRNRSKVSNHKICFSSRVLLSNKGFPKSMRSITKQQVDEIQLQQKICLLQIDSKQQLNNLLKLIKREQISNDVTIIIVTENENITNQENILVLKLNSEDMTQLQKQIQNIVNIQKKQNSEAAMEQAIVQYIQKRQKLKLNIKYLIDIFVISHIQQLKNILQKEVPIQKLDVLIKFTHEERNKYEVVKSEEEDDQNYLKKLNDWIKSATQFFKKGVETLSEEDHIGKLKTERNMLSLQHQKIAKYFIRIYQIIVFFQTNKRLPSYLSTSKFIGIVKDIFKSDNQTNINKRNVNILKLINSLRIISWNHIACIYMEKYMILLVIFIFADDPDCADYNNRQLCELLELCFQNYEENVLQENIIGQPSKTNLMVELLMRKTDEHEIDQNKEDQNNQSGIEITDLFKKQLRKLQLYLKQKGIKDSISNFRKEWYYFFCEMDASTVKIPANLLISNKLLLFYFLTLIRPGETMQWLKNSDKQKYLYRQKGNDSSNVSKASQQKSCLSEWSSVGNILNYMYSNLRIKQNLLINIKMQQIVEICINNKIPFVHLDFTTIFWKIQKEIQKVRLFETNSEVDNNQNREQIYQRQQQKILDDIKSYIKSQYWIIININHSKLIGMSSGAYFKRINSMIESVLSSKYDLTSSHLFEHLTETNLFKKKVVKINSNIDISLYKYMIIYLMDVPQQKYPLIGNTPDTKERLQIINHFMLSSKQYIHFKHKRSHFQQQELIFYIKNFSTIFYSDLNKSKRSKKEYQKLSFCRKKMIYEYIHISQSIIKEISITALAEKQILESSYIEELFSKIYGCINIIKNKDHFDLTEEEELSLKSCKTNTNSFITSKQELPTETKQSIALSKIQEYITVMLEYTFLLNYKVSALGARICTTYEYISTVRAALQHLSNYELEFIVLHLNASETQIILQPISMFDETQNLKLDLICNNFQPEGLMLDVQQIKTNLSIKQKEEKVLTKFIQQNPWDYHSKMREASLLYEKQIELIESAIQILKLFNLKDIYEQFRDLSNEIENILSHCDIKLSSKNQKLMKGKMESKSVNTFVAVALTQILTIQNVTANHGQIKYEMLQFQKYLLRFLILLRNKISSFCLFLQEVKDIVKDYFDLEFISSVRLQSDDSLAQSEDDQESIRRKQEEELKYLIKKRVHIKNSVDILMRKLNNVYYKMFTSPNHQKKDLTLKEINKICTLLLMTKQYVPYIKLEVQESTTNYSLYQKQGRTNNLNIQGSLYSQFNSDDFQFSLKTHRLAQIIQLIEIIHSKKHNQQIHHLKYSLQLCLQKKRRLNQSRIYFKGFSIMNAIWKNKNGKIELEPAMGNKQDCGQMMIEAAINEQNQIYSQNSIDDLQNGYLWYSCPLYLSDLDNMVEIKERVKLQIKQLQEPLLLRSNIYLINY